MTIQPSFVQWMSQAESYISGTAWKMLTVLILVCVLLGRDWAGESKED